MLFRSLRLRISAQPVGVSLAVVTGALGALGALSYLYAITRGRVSLVVSFTALYPALTIVLAALFLHEAITPRQWAGVLLAMAAMALIAA